MLHVHNMEDLAQAVQRLEFALKLCATNLFYQRQCYLSMGSAYHMRYTATQELADLDLSVENLEQAVALVTQDFHARRAYMRSLIDVLQTRFERTENLPDLEWIKQLRARL